MKQVMGYFLLVSSSLFSMQQSLYQASLRYPPLQVLPIPGCSIQFNHESSYFAVTVPQENAVKIYHTATGQCITALSAIPPTPVRSALFIKNLMVAIAGKPMPDGRIHIWNLENCFYQCLNGHQQPILHVQGNRKETLFATASEDHTARLWNPGTMALVYTFIGHEHIVNSAVFNRAGTQLATTSNDKTARVWDTTTGLCLHILKGHKGPVLNASFNRTGDRLVTTAEDHRAHVFELAFGERIHILDSNEVVRSWVVAPGSVSSALFNPQNNQIATAMINAGNFYGDQRVYLWHPNSSDIYYAFSNNQANYTSMETHQLAFNHNGTLLASADNNQLSILDVKTGTLLHSLALDSGHEAETIKRPLFTKDGNRLAITTNYGTVYILYDPKPKACMVAFLCALHPRCGAHSPARILNQELMRRITRVCLQSSFEKSSEFYGFSLCAIS